MILFNFKKYLFIKITIYFFLFLLLFFNKFIIINYNIMIIELISFVALILFLLLIKTTIHV